MPNPPLTDLLVACTCGACRSGELPTVYHLSGDKSARKALPA